MQGLQRTCGGSGRPGHSEDSKQTENSGGDLRPRVGDQSASQQERDYRGLAALDSENIQKTKILASTSTSSQQINGETMETGRDLILGGSKITVDGDCSPENKRRLILGIKAVTDLDSILKSRNIANKCPSGQTYGFSSSHVWM